MEGPDGQAPPPRTEPSPGDKVFLPIIPLMGTATEPVTLLNWPSYSQGELDVASRSRLRLAWGRWSSAT